MDAYEKRLIALGLSIIPGGSSIVSLAELIGLLCKNQNFEEELAKVNQEHFENLLNDLKRLEGKVSEKASAEEVFEIAQNAIIFSRLTTSYEKRRRFRNIAINSLNPKFDHEDAKMLFLKMVADFEDVHIQVLTAYGMTAEINIGSKTYELGQTDERLVGLLRADGIQGMSYEVQEMTGWGTISASFISQKTIFEYIKIGKDNLRKVINDLSSNGCFLERDVSDDDDGSGSKSISAFGARFLLFISEETAESFLVD